MAQSIDDGDDTPPPRSGTLAIVASVLVHALLLLLIVVATNRLSSPAGQSRRTDAAQVESRTLPAYHPPMHPAVAPPTKTSLVPTPREPFSPVAAPTDSQPLVSDVGTAHDSSLATPSATITGTRITGPVASRLLTITITTPLGASPSIVPRPCHAMATRTGEAGLPFYECHDSVIPVPRDCPAPPDSGLTTPTMVHVVGQVLDASDHSAVDGAHLQMWGTGYGTFSNAGRYELAVDLRLIAGCRPQFLDVVAPGYKRNQLVNFTVTKALAGPVVLLRRG